MYVPPSFTINADEWEQVLQQVPNGAGVYALWLAAGQPYLGKTRFLQRRLQRLLGAGERGTRVRASLQRIECWPTQGALASSLTQYGVARHLFGHAARDQLRLRQPYYVKLITSNAFPRLTVTQRLSAGDGQWYGPFRVRGEAEAFEAAVLDQFPVRRCLEDLHPSSDHPGCVYGEMQKCLRPCQAAVTAAEYRGEVRRVSEFLLTDGESQLVPITAARDRASAELDFEGAARAHASLERLNAALRWRGDLARDIDQLHGLAVTPNGAVWPVMAGVWQGPREATGNLSAISPRTVSTDEKQDHLALLARWFYSSWREGEWIPVDSWTKLPLRKLKNALTRVAAK